MDEGFRNRLYDILNDWREGIMLAVDRGQQAGTVRKDAEPAAVAAFILGSLEGCAGLAKANQSREFLEAGMRGMTDYLEHMRA